MMVANTDYVTGGEPILRGLTAEKVAAVTTRAERVRVVAAPGTGKTETLTRRIVWLLCKENVPPKAIVAFTFTEKAAQNMKERIYDRVEEMGGLGLIKQLGAMYVGTMHAFAARVLQDDPDYGHYDLLSENEEIAFLLRHGWGIGLNATGRYSDNKDYVTKCINFLKNVGVIYNELLDPAAVSQAGGGYADFAEDFRQYEQKLDDEHLLTLGRLIPLAVKGLTTRREALADVRYLLVDEFQDINPAQHELIKAIEKNADVFIVGDPRQTIYQWRGSDCSCFSKFAYKREVHDVELQKNRRSTWAVIGTANSFARQGKWAREYKLMEGERPERGAAFLLTAETPEDEAAKITALIERAHAAGVPYGETAILLRSVKTSAPPFVAALRGQNIPFVLRGRVGLFRRREVQALGAIFTWLGPASGWWTPEEEWRGKTELSGDDCLAYALDSWNAFGKDVGARFTLKTARAELKRVKKAVSESPMRESDFPTVTDLYYRILEILGLKKLDADAPGGIGEKQAVALANLGRFAEVLTDYQGPQRRRGANPEWPGFLKNLNYYLRTYAANVYEERVAEDVERVNAVQVLTVHQAKGLEWTVVFVPALQDNRFPSSLTGRPFRYWRVPEKLFDRSRYEGSEEDERRLFYVAVTRAVDYAVLSHFGRTAKRKSRPSRFVTEIESDLEPLPPAFKFVPLKRLKETREFKTFTVGDIVRYRRCPYWYRLNLLWGFQPALTKFLGYGKDLHYILRRIGEEAKTGAAPLDIVDDMTRRYFMLPYMSQKLSDDFAARMARKIRTFIQEHPEEMGAIEEVEARVEFLLGEEGSIKATVKGVIDVLLAAAGEVEVRDYKTSEETATEDEVRSQVLLYAAGMGALGRKVDKGSAAYIDEGTIKPWPINKADVDAETAVTTADVTAIILKKEFRPKRGAGGCKRCDFPTICRFSKVSPKTARAAKPSPPKGKPTKRRTPRASRPTTRRRA